MRQITKGAEPPSLTAHRRTPYSNFDNYADKNALREVLVTEQRGICCYCMKRIHNDPNETKIEHWKCQSRFPNEQINYRNLLCACKGNEGMPPRLHHCDTRKGDQDLLWNPADPDHHIETRIYYGSDGAIRSDEPVFDKQLNEILNLNHPQIRNNRKAALDAIVEWWKKKRDRFQHQVPRSLLEGERDKIIGGTDLLQEYSQIKVWFLDRKIRSMSQ